MPVGPAYRPDPLFQALGPEFSDVVAPAAFPEAILRYRNDRAAETVGLQGLTDAEWITHFARFEPLPQNQPSPLAMRYHGHQFRSYNPDLGDGRGFLFGQVREAQAGRLLDFGTKGSGTTPWSRTADGRLTLKGGMREILAAEMLEALGAPTSRAFSLVETGEALMRGDEPSPTRSAVLTRLSHSHIRFGTLQRLAYLDRRDLMEILVEHVITTYHPGSNGPAQMFAAVVAATAELTAAWMAAGFVHGVLNTDNMNVTGESFDYGPWRFLPHNDPGFTAAYFDHTGLYAFGRQPEAAFWNLRQLGGALTLVADPDALTEVLNTFEPLYITALTRAVLARLGVASKDAEADRDLAAVTFRALAAGGAALRWEPLFFDWFAGSASKARAMQGPRRAVYESPAFAEFTAAILGFEPDRPERLSAPFFSRDEPEEMLIDEVEALWAPIAAADDWSMLEAKLSRIAQAREGYAIAR